MKPKFLCLCIERKVVFSQWWNLEPCVLRPAVKGAERPLTRLWNPASVVVDPASTRATLRSRHDGAVCGLLRLQSQAESTDIHWARFDVVMKPSVSSADLGAWSLEPQDWRASAAWSWEGTPVVSCFFGLSCTVTIPSLLWRPQSKIWVWQGWACRGSQWGSSLFVLALLFQSQTSLQDCQNWNKMAEQCFPNVL